MFCREIEPELFHNQYKVIYFLNSNKIIKFTLKKYKQQQQQNPSLVFQTISPRPQSQESKSLWLELVWPYGWSQSTVNFTAVGKRASPRLRRSVAMTGVSSFCAGSQWAVPGWGAHPILKSGKTKGWKKNQADWQRRAGNRRGSPPGRHSPALGSRSAITSSMTRIGGDKEPVKLINLVEERAILVPGVPQLTQPWRWHSKDHTNYIKLPVGWSQDKPSQGSRGDGGGRSKLVTPVC